MDFGLPNKSRHRTAVCPWDRCLGDWKLRQVRARRSVSSDVRRRHDTMSDISAWVGTLSQSTKDRLKKWAAIPDARLTEHSDYPPDITWTADETQSFEAEGRELWGMLQRELGAGVCVVYHSTTERRDLFTDGDS